MPATDYQGSSVPFASIGRSILSIRRENFDTSGGGGAADIDLESFQKQVADHFHDLTASASPILSLPWLLSLLDAFLICQEEFRVILFTAAPLLPRPPLDRLVNDFFDRSVKALDVCNAVRDGVEQVRQWLRHLDIVLSALGHPLLGEGQLRRAKKALTDLTLLMLDEKEGSSTSAAAHRNRSFGRNTKDSSSRGTHFRSLSWSVSRSWSANRQLQAIGNNLAAPRGAEITATSGLALPVFTMNSVLLFVMWALVAAIPCQDRGLQTHFSIPRTFPWAAPVLSLHDQILEESKKRERKNSNGLLKEIYQMEKCSRHLMELTDAIQFPLAEDKEKEVKKAVEELAEVCGSMKDGLDLLERQVREVFHRIVRSRTEGLDCLGKAHNPE